MALIQNILNPRKAPGRRIGRPFDGLIDGRRCAFVLAHDLVMAAASVILALYLRLGHLGTGSATTEFILVGIPIFCVVFLAAMLFFRMHLSLWRYTSTAELLSVVKAVTISIVAFYSIYFALQRGEGLPRSLPVIQWFVLVFALTGSRIAYRLAGTSTDLVLGRRHSKDAKQRRHTSTELHKDPNLEESENHETPFSIRYDVDFEAMNEADWLQANLVEVHLEARRRAKSLDETLAYVSARCAGVGKP